MPKPNKEIKQLLINDFGYEPVELESYTGQLRALKESFNSLQIKDPKDPRLKELAIAIKDLRAQREVEKDKTGKLKVTRKRRSDAKSAEQIKDEIDAKDKAIADRKAKKKKDAMNFISPGSKPPELPPAENTGSGDMSSSLMKISNDVNIIKGIVESQEKLEKDKMEDTREAREKKKRGMAENLLEGSKKAFGKVKDVAAKMLKPLEGIFSRIFKFLTLFILGSGLMKLLDWMGNPENKSKMQSIFRFLADWWPAIVGALMAFLPGFPIITGVIALAIGYLPKLIDTVKMLFGFGKQVDKEIAKNEKDLTKETTVKLDDKAGEDPPKQGDDPNAVVDVPEGAGEKPKVTEPPMYANKGGEVPGQGNTDTVPAMLTPGEFVLTKDAVKKYGTDTLYGMNAAAGGVDKSNDVPRGPSGKPIKKTMKKKSTVQTMMDMGGLNPINNISKSMNNVTNNTSNNISKPTSNVTNNINTSKSTSDVTNNSLSDMTNNISKSNVTNNIAETMNMSGGGMTKNMSYMGGGGMTKNTTYMSDGGMTKNTSYMSDGGMTKNMSYMNSGGMVTNNIGGTSNVQYMKLGGMVKNFISNSPQARFLKFAGNQISKTPQARLLRFAAKQIKKLPVKPPAAKALKALKALGMKNTPPSPMTSEGGDSSVNEIPRFSVIASGGRAKEQTLGIRR
jgi:hypothetical protein